jgi:hypothetical protein
MPEQNDAYLSMTTEDIARLILCLIIEEALRTRLDLNQAMFEV